MTVDTNSIVAMTEANQNFSKVTRLVDEEGIAVILKNNKPKYVVVAFDEYDLIKSAKEARKKMISEATDAVINENTEAFSELAK